MKDTIRSTGFGEQRELAARRMRRRLVAHLAAGGTTDAADTTRRCDRSAYVDSGVALRERQRLFLQLPLVAGLSRDVPSPGDVLLFEEVGAPILIVRGKDGAVRGFLNMCTHRASRLVSPHTDRRGTSRERLVCPFHGWSFDLEGKLVGVPGFAGCGDAEPSGRHLVPVPVAERHGLVFVQPAPTRRTIDVAAYLGAFASEMAQLELDALEPIRHGVFAASTNWKLALDTYCEGYHFGVLHRATIGRSHHSNVAVFDDFAPHWRLAFAERSLDALVGRPESEWPPARYDGVHFIFPNTILVVGSLGTGEMWARMFRLFPGADAGTMVCCIGVYAPACVARNAERVAREFGCDDAESDVTREDYAIAVDAYRNLQYAPEGFELVFGRNEPALQAFHRAIDQRMGEPG